jgi:hypothetical protein
MVFTLDTFVFSHGHETICMFIFYIVPIILILAERFLIICKLTCIVYIGNVSFHTYKSSRGARVSVLSAGTASPPRL